MVTKEVMSRTLEDLHDLPTLPSVIDRVMKASADPNVDVSVLAGEISIDPVLTAKILKVVNSSFYPFRREISSVKEATTVLGLSAVGAIALTSSVIDRLKIENQSGLFYRGLFWAHSIGSAICAEAIAKEIGYPRPDIAFTATMIHDIGKVVLDRYFSEDFRNVLSRARSSQAYFHEIELEVLPATHAEVGERLALKWGLGKTVAKAIAYHHTSQDASSDPEVPDPVLCGLAAAGNNVCGSLAIGSSGNWKRVEVDYDLLERLGMSGRKVAALLDKAHDISARVQGFMQTVSS